MDDTSISRDNTLNRDNCYYVIWMNLLIPLCNISLVLDSSFDFDSETSNISHKAQ